MVNWLISEYPEYYEQEESNIIDYCRNENMMGNICTLKFSIINSSTQGEIQQVLITICKRGHLQILECYKNILPNYISSSLIREAILRKEITNQEIM